MGLSQHRETSHSRAADVIGSIFSSYSSANHSHSKTGYFVDLRQESRHWKTPHSNGAPGTQEILNKVFGARETPKKPKEFNENLGSLKKHIENEEDISEWFRNFEEKNKELFSFPKRENHPFSQTADAFKWTEGVFDLGSSFKESSSTKIRRDLGDYSSSGKIDRNDRHKMRLSAYLEGEKEQNEARDSLARNDTKINVKLESEKLTQRIFGKIF